jgi:osmotically-inducible protein OsmY
MKASTVLDDNGLANAIQCELRHDALTAALPIEVEVWDRVVHLRGVVSGANEAEAAESVAERVEGVGLVADDLEMHFP